MATSHRHGFGSPPKYRRSTIDIYHSLETGQHTPTASVLDRKWVHRSLGDLTSDNDLQLSHPRLSSKFYQELYQKYPKAFQRRREARDAGRKLFNPKPHVKFEDEVVDDMSLKSYRSERPTTNWDREVGHYKNIRSRDCFTSAEPSETGSVLSVKERLHLNSQTLNRLLNEKSPLRKRFSEENNLKFHSERQNNENLPVDSLLYNKNRLRFRHRKVLQRKVDNKQTGAFYEHLDELRKPVSLSGEYSRRARTVSPTNAKHKHVDVEALLANADLEINTLLEKINMKLSGPESPPDSAIDVDTPSLRSLATTERGSNSDLPLSVPQDYVFQNVNDLTAVSESYNGAKTLCVDTGKSADKSKHKYEYEVLDPLKDPDNLLLLKEYDMNIDDIQMPGESDIKRTSACNVIAADSLSLKDRSEDNADINTETDDIADFVQNNHDTLESGEGQGMLQLYETKSKHNRNEEGLSHAVEMTSDIKPVEYSNRELVPSKRTIGTNKNLEMITSLPVPTNGILNSVETEGKQSVVQGEKQLHVPELEDSNQDKHYQADDEAELVENAVSKTKSATVSSSKKIPLHRDSDVDSGIGQSGTDTRSPQPVPPPRGRSRQRGAASKTQPVRADHSILPLRSEVDTCILNEVDLTKLAHDLSHGPGRRGNHVDEVDDTDPARETVKISSEEQKLTEKYRRQRSPSPYVLKGSRHTSPRFRAQSAPIYYTGTLDLHVVDISLSNDSLSDISLSVSNTVNDVSVSGIDTFNSSNFNHHIKSVQNETSCQTNEQPSSNVHPSKQQTNILTSNLTNVQPYMDSDPKSSSPVEQRKNSTSTCSSVSSADTETAVNNVYVNQVVNSHLIGKKSDDRNVLTDGEQISEDVNQFKNIVYYDNSTTDQVNQRSDPHEFYAESKHCDFRENANIAVDENIDQVISCVKHKRETDVSDLVQKSSIYENLKLNQVEHKREANVSDLEKKSSINENLKLNQVQASNQNLPDNYEIISQKGVATSKGNSVSLYDGHAEPAVIEKHKDFGLHSTNKLNIVKPKVESQSSVESRESFESVELGESERTGVHHEQIKEIRRIYKPSANSPRVKDKKTNMRNIFKHKKGRFSPGFEQTMHLSNQNEIVLTGCDKINPEGSENLKTSGNVMGQENLHVSAHNPVNEKHNGIKGMNENYDYVQSDSHPTYSARPVIINPEDTKSLQNGRSVQEQHFSAPQKILRAELNLSKYKISSDKKIDVDVTGGQKHEKLGQSCGSRWSQGSQKSNESSRSCDSAVSNVSQRSHVAQGSFESDPAVKNLSDGHQHKEARKKRSKYDDGEIVVEESNLQKSKGLSASKGSLLDKMGGLKTATKGKFKAMRKAMSLERGIDVVGNDPHGQNKPESKGGHSFFPKMKKAPSLKTLAGLFGRKKKKGKYAAEDVEASTSGMAPRVSAGSAGSLSSDKRKQWASCHTLSSVEIAVDSGSIGKLLKLNPDGTQIIELKRPASGHLGFFIAQGNPKYKKGVFVSRFSKEGPEKISGLLGIGDEILEVNRHLVHDLSLDTVYKLMGASPTITLKIFPLIARKDL